MSRKPKIALVLGAGSSISMGYPVGSLLRERLLLLSSAGYLPFAIDAGLINESGELSKFIHEFRRSQMASIDAFLARRPEFSDIGKKSIAALLLDIENKDHLFTTEHEDHWLRYFFNTFSSESWGDFDLSNISIVTFNYDRSMEAYLHGAIQASYNKSSEEATKKIREMKFIHVYGLLGSPLKEEPNFLPYGEPISHARVQSAATMIKVIPEGRNDDETLSEAREALRQADRIAFMGFGFDQTNLLRINATETCKRKSRVDSMPRTRRVAATCHGLTYAQVMVACRNAGLEYDGYELQNGLPPNFFSSNCLTLLRETLILE